MCKTKPSLHYFTSAMHFLSEQLPNIVYGLSGGLPPAHVATGGGAGALENLFHGNWSVF